MQKLYARTCNIYVRCDVSIRFDRSTYVYTYVSKYLYKYKILQILYSLIILLITLYSASYSALYRIYIGGTSKFWGIFL